MSSVVRSALVFKLSKHGDMILLMGKKVDNERSSLLQEEYFALRRVFCSFAPYNNSGESYSRGGFFSLSHLFYSVCL